MPDFLSFFLLKPDAIDRGLRGEISNAIKLEELTLTETFDVRLTRWDLLCLYPRIRTLKAWLRSEQYLAHRWIPVMVVGGEDAISRMRRLKIALRSRYPDPQDAYYTLVHAPDTPEDADRELNVLRKFGRNQSRYELECH